MENSVLEPLVTLDIDGTMGDFVGSMRDSARRRGLNVTDRDPVDYSMIGDGWFRDKGEFLDTYADMIDHGGLLDQKVLDRNVGDVLDSLATDGFRFRVGTARFHRTLPVSELHRQSYQWFTEKVSDDLITPEDLTIGDDKTATGGQVYIEDAPYQWEALTKAGHRVYLRDQAYNQGVSTPLRFRDFSQLGDMLTADRKDGLL